MSDSSDLDRALRALAAETDDDAAPAVEVRVRAAFRAAPPSGDATHDAPSPWIWAASLAAAAGVVWMVLAPRVAETPVPAAPTARVEPTSPAPRATVEPARVAAVAAASRPARVRPRARAADPEPFQALYPGDPLADLDAVHVVRVSVPRSSLVALGLGGRPDTSGGSVEMDAMVGPDGVARAVRFVTAR